MVGKLAMYDILSDDLNTVKLRYRTEDLLLVTRGHKSLGAKREWWNSMSLDNDEKERNTSLFTS